MDRNLNSYFEQDLDFIERDSLIGGPYMVKDVSISNVYLDEALAQSLNPDKAKVIIGNPLRSGVGAIDRSYTLYDRPFMKSSIGPNGRSYDIWNHCIPQPTRGEAMWEAVESMKDHSDHASFEFNPHRKQPKWVTRNPSFSHIWHDRAVKETAERALKIDTVSIRNFQFDRWLQGIRNNMTQREIEAYSGKNGKIIKRINNFIKPELPEADINTHIGLRGRVCNDKYDGPGAFSVKLLLASPPLLSNFLERRPKLTVEIGRILEKIAKNSSYLIPEKEVRTLNNTIHQALRYGEVNRLFDPRMIYLVKVRDPSYIQTGIVRDNLERIKRIIRVYPEFAPNLKHVIFPMAVKLMLENKDVSPGVIRANINPMKNLRETLIIIQNRSKNPVWCKEVKYIMQLANMEEKRILARYSPNVIYSMAKTIGNGVITPVIVHPQMLFDPPVSTVNIGIPWDGNINIPKPQSGAYFTQGPKRLEMGKWVTQPNAPIDRHIYQSHFAPYMKYGFAKDKEVY